MNDIKVPPFTEEQKKLIEAAERIANGKLICDVDDDIDEIPANPCKDCISKNVCGNPNITGCISYTKQDEKFLPINCYVCNASGRIAGNSYRHPSKCKRCNGTGEINFYTMTNEDEIKMSPTSKLAEWIAKNIRDTIKLTNGNTEYTELITSAEWWYRWLKQPHTKE